MIPDDCSLPELPEPYAGALREAVAFVFTRCQPLGIYACGTIVRGNPGPTSDHDLYVLVPGTKKQRIQKRFCGVPAEIFLNPPAAVEAYFEENREDNRPVTAHMIGTGVIVCDRDPCVKRIHALARDYLARRPEISEDRWNWLRYAAALFYEDACDVFESDPETADMLLGHAAIEMLRHAFFARERRSIPRFKELLGTVESLDPDVGRLARRFFASRSLSERRTLAGQLADQVCGARGFFEWESDWVDLAE